jgi:hypothetical protein
LTGKSVANNAPSVSQTVRKTVAAVQDAAQSTSNKVKGLLTREGAQKELSATSTPAVQKTVAAEPSASESRFFTSKTEFQAPSNGTGYKYTVHQQDIDLTLYIPSRGKTNAELMQSGGAPYVEKDGGLSQINLHHSRQHSQGTLFEVSNVTHQAKTGRGAEALHPYKTIRGRQSNGNGSGPANSQHPTNPIDRGKFDTDREAYWKERYEKLTK